MSRLRSVTIATVLGAACCVAVGACNAVFGISEAQVDPSLTAQGGGGGAASSTTSSTTTTTTTTSTTSSTTSSTAGSGGAGTGGAGGGTTSAGGGGSTGQTCDKYCSLVEANCKDYDDEYVTRDVCMVMCAQFDPGMPGDMDNDSLACRFAHAELAATDPDGECQKAGPLAIACTDCCAAFCILDFGLCEPDGLFPYADIAGCKAACAGYTYLTSSPGGMEGDIVFLAGDTLNCRLYHLESAYNPAVMGATAVHCPHTGSSSATCN